MLIVCPKYSQVVNPFNVNPAQATHASQIPKIVTPSAFASVAAAAPSQMKPPQAQPQQQPQQQNHEYVKVQPSWPELFEQSQNAMNKLRSDLGTMYP